MIVDSTDVDHLYKSVCSILFGAVEGRGVMPNSVGTIHDGADIRVYGKNFKINIVHCKYYVERQHVEDDLEKHIKDLNLAKMKREIKDRSIDPRLIFYATTESEYMMDYQRTCYVHTLYYAEEIK